MKRLVLLLIPVVLLLGWLWARGSGPLEVPFTRAVRETIVSTLNTNGKVEPIEWAAAHAQAGGPLLSIHVEKGQAIRQGQVLVSMAVPQAQAELARAQAQIEAAKAELETLNQGGRATEQADIQSGILRAKSDLEVARREYETLRRLAEKNAATKIEVEAARQTMERAQQQIQSYELRRGALVTPPDKSAAQARLREAQGSANAASIRIATGQVVSPANGVVYRLEARPGGYLNAGDLVAEVGRLNQLRVRVYVDEPDIGRVEKGLPVTITWDALPGRRWQGVVEKVPLQVTSLGTRQVGEVLVTIDNPDQNLIPGTNVNAEIRSRVAENTLSIPKEAVRRQGTATGVFSLEGDRLAWKPVKLGIASVTKVQVIEGLKEGDPVALPIERPLKAGEQVKGIFP